MIKVYGIDQKYYIIAKNIKNINVKEYTNISNKQCIFCSFINGNIYVPSQFVNVNLNDFWVINYLQPEVIEPESTILPEKFVEPKSAMLSEKEIISKSPILSETVMKLDEPMLGCRSLFQLNQLYVNHELIIEKCNSLAGYKSLDID